MLSVVDARYSAASKQAEPGLCCPVEYDPKYLKVIPSDVTERDYGCGDPVSQVRPGENVLDLGCGGGKVCFIAAQIVGLTGSVLGVDLNDDMLGLARRAQPEVARQLGYGNVTFAKARIEDLALDLEFLDAHLRRHPVAGHKDLLRLNDLTERLRRDSPLVPSGSVDVVISNCVLNLVSTPHKEGMFAELARVLRPGGRAVISDIVSDVDVPAVLREQPELWSGCYSGAMQEQHFLDSFRQAGLVGVRLLKRELRPWKTIGNVTFRSITVEAHQPLTRPASRGRQAVLYRGPYSVVEIDGLRLPCGDLVSVTPDEVTRLLTEPFRNDLILFEEELAGPPSVAECEHPADAEVKRSYRPVPIEAAGHIPDGPNCC